MFRKVWNEKTTHLPAGVFLDMMLLKWFWHAKGVDGQ